MPTRTQTPIERLIEQHADRAYAAAFRLTGDAAEASDLVQESFLRAIEKAGLYDPSLEFGAWLQRLIYRVFLNRCRSRTRRREVPLEPVEGEADQWEAPPSESPESALDRQELRNALQSAIQGLAPDLRACLLLVDGEGRSYEEAAEMLGWPVGSVAGRLFRARRLLRRRLGER